MANKKTIFFSLCLLFISSCVTSQKSKFTVFGTITDCRTNEAIKGVTIKLVGSDGTSIETKSDTLGNYSFSDCFKNKTNYVLSTQVDNTVGVSPAVKYGSCPNEWHEKEGYLNDSNKHKFSYSDTLLQQQFDFCLSQVLACGPAPTFYFKKNNTEFLKAEWIKEENADTTVDCFVGFLMVHKNLVIEIGGHTSSDEKNKKELSDSRTKKLRDLLISKGIDKERLVCRSYSDSRPAGYYTEEGKWIENDKTNEKNRRIDIMALRRDYDPKTKKPFVEENKTKKTIGESEEEK